MDWTKVQKKTKIKKFHEDIIPVKPEYKLLINQPLTETELDMIDNNQLIDVCCYCCNADFISKIIKRPFYKCFKCYCCIGDVYINEDTDIYVCNHNGIEHYVYKEKERIHKITNLDFNEEYKEYDDYNFKKNRKHN